jgi:hypothetical protein
MYMGPYTKTEDYSWQKEKLLKINRRSWICWPLYACQKNWSLSIALGTKKQKHPYPEETERQTKQPER